MSFLCEWLVKGKLIIVFSDWFIVIVIRLEGNWLLRLVKCICFDYCLDENGIIIIFLVFLVFVYVWYKSWIIL